MYGSLLNWIRKIYQRYVHPFDGWIRILTKEEAVKEVEQLKDKIKSWLGTQEEAIDADSWLYIGKELKKNE